jgi:hypothetical protein
MTPEEMIHELDAFSRRVVASTTALEIDDIISNARVKLAPCGQSDHDILTRLSEAVNRLPPGDMRRSYGRESAGDAPTKDNDMMFLAFTKLLELKKQL